MIERVYIETSIVSYLTAKPNRDLVIAAHQQITHDWWGLRRLTFELCISQLVLDEAGGGDPVAAQDRLEVLKPMLVLETTKEAINLAKELLKVGALPAKAANDALHIAIAATMDVTYLLTWNCRHLANANKFGHIRTVNTMLGLFVPALVTPLELIGEDDGSEPE